MQEIEITQPDEYTAHWRNIEADQMYNIISLVARECGLSESRIYDVFARANPLMIIGTRNDSSCYVRIHPEHLKEFRVMLKMEMSLPF